MTEDEYNEIVDKVIAARQGKRLGCTHPFRHTVYGAEDPADNGTTCVACGVKL